MNLDTLPVLGFKFSEVFECSKDRNHCKDNDFMFDGIIYCNSDGNRTLQYCRDSVKLQYLIVLVGFDNQTKQTYQALRQTSNGFEIIEDKDMKVSNLKARSLLSVNDRGTFLKVNGSGETLISVLYYRSNYELVFNQ